MVLRAIAYLIHVGQVEVGWELREQTPVQGRTTLMLELESERLWHTVATIERIGPTPPRPRA